MIRFQNHDCIPLAGELIYKEYEYSFDFEAEAQSELARGAGSAGTTSLVIGTLQIEIGIETKLALFVWGFHTYIGLWVRDRLPTISSHPGCLKVLLDQEPILGVSQSLVEVEQVLTTYDTDSDWIRVSLGEYEIADGYVEFAEDTVAGLLNEKLVSLWLRPAWHRERLGEEGITF